MSDIVLSAGIRSNLLNLQRTSDLISLTQTRLATGKRVNSALDNPTNFFTAQSLNNRAGDLSSLLDSMGNAVKTLEAADNGISAITKLVDSAQATARQAQQTTDTTERSDLAAQFDDILTQIDQLAADSGFNGKNLINGDDLDVVFNEDASSTLTITGVDDTTGGDLAISGAANNWAADADIQAALDDITAGLGTLRSQSMTEAILAQCLPLPPYISVELATGAGSAANISEGAPKVVSDATFHAARSRIESSALRIPASQVPARSAAPLAGPDSIS